MGLRIAMLPAIVLPILMLIAVAVLAATLFEEDRSKQRINADFNKRMDRLEAEFQRQDEEFQAMILGAGECDVNTFLDASDSGEHDFTGVYILHNVDKDMYYVGQSVRVLARVRQHFSGNGGNGDVYADFVYGDDFTIRTISLVDSGYDNINDLEKDLIEAYDAYEGGYNRTRGNRG